MSSDFTIKTEVFEGPLELLLHLIEKRKLLINDVSIAQVTDDYITYIKEHETELPIEKVTHFIVIASTLVLIKSKSLLPTLSLTEEETASVADLELRLKIYQRIMRASETIASVFGKHVLFSRQTVKRAAEPTFAPPEHLSLEQLHQSIQTVLHTLPKKERVPQAVVKKVVSLEEMIDTLTKRVQAGLQMRFREFASVDKTEKVNVIVSFLAMLELVKRGLLAVEQEADGDIRMETTEVSAPKYL